ncbi:hypothetical protein SAY87_010664 [Trapa incisa]|uniref:BAT2 N-terminal domain-containing protein n=1 Tax=Trapa incisa TaxID=236973 RepID=A0AAN7JI65_9MYRT|nr:hypothetical protein SAY87_010664 [Trapa incisa]
MLNGEQGRWAFARRGGMTVLGKISVPKPINLPSQRMENHGVDPNVEIVPKGTRSWGSRPSSSTSNAWSSLSLSPNATSSSDSPSHLSARPSSAEGGTRPSTSGSDKVHDSTPNAWSSNLRPSSASGVLTSNQASPISLRPHSAEPRTGSSQLSRFAEPSCDISVPGNGERLEANSLKNDGFSLNTGDFPTLGSVKSGSGKIAGSQDPSLQDSGSTGGLDLTKDISENYSVGVAPLNTEANGKTDESWRRDNIPHNEDGPMAGMEKWDGDTPPYQNPGILPQHFNPWHGPHVNNLPGGIWYRGPPSGPLPYRGTIPPGGFPMEPFHYYRPQGPSSTPPNPQQVPPPGTVPRGTHPRNGDMYRSQMPDSYIRPGMPVRPGFFPGPVPYDVYFGHPMGYCRPNDHDLPSMGIIGGPPIYGQFPTQSAHDSANSLIRPPGHGLNSGMCSSDEVESGHPHDPQPYRVLLKSHDNWNEKSDLQKQEETKKNSGFMQEETQTGNGSKEMDYSRASSGENAWRKDGWKDGEKDLKVGVVDDDASQSFNDRISGSFVPSKVNSLENVESPSVVRDHGRGGQNNYVSPVVPQSVASKDSSLIQKIEGLNAKARASDLRPDFIIVSDRPEQGHMLHDQGTKSSLSAAGNGNHAPYPANAQVAQDVSTEGKILEEPAISGPTTSRRFPHNRHGKAHHHWGKGKLNLGGVDGFLNKPAVLDPLLPTPPEFSDVHRTSHRSYQPRKKYEEGYVPVTSGPGNIQTERTKMKEQCVKQKQEEKDEDCSREPKAETHVNLDELNRCMQVVEDLNSKTESSLLNKQEDLTPPVESTKIYGSPALSNPTPVSNGEIFQQTRNRSTVGRSSNLSKEFQQDLPNDPHKKSFIIHNQSMLVKQDTEIAGDNTDVAAQIHGNVPSKQHRSGYKHKQSLLARQNAEIAGDNSDIAAQIHDNGPSKQHRTGYKHKQSMAFEKNTQNIAAEPPKSEVNVADDVFTTVDAGADTTAHQRRRNNKNRNKYKGDESSPANNLQSLVPKESAGVSTASVKSNVKLKTETEDSVVVTASKPVDVNHLVVQHPGSVHEEVHGWGNNQWKPQYSHRAPRNMQVTRVADKFHGGDTAVWTPVRTHNRTEIGEETNDRTAVGNQSLSVKGDQPLQSSNSRSKRSEIERYVPKPIAKEMAQQGTIQHGVALDGQIKMADDAVQQVDTESSSSLAVKELRTVDSRHIRHGRGHGLWRQRGMTENGLQVGQSNSHLSQISENVQRQPEHDRRPKPEEQPSMEQIKLRDEGIPCGSITDPSNASTMECQPRLVSPAGRNQGTPGRGKCHPYFKATTYENPDQKKSSDELELSHNPSIAPEVTQTDPASAPSIPRENHGIFERSTLHWQPKSRVLSGQNLQAKRATDYPNAAESGRPYIVKVPKEQNDKMQEESKIHEEARQVDNSRRERRPRSSTALPQSSVHVAPKSEESGNQQDQAGFSVGLGKSGNQSASRFVRSDEKHGDWGSNRQDVRQHNVLTHPERHRHSFSYKYQPVAPQNGEYRSGQFEGQRDGSQGTGPRYKRAGKSGSGHGDGGSSGVNFNERKVGNV